MQQEIIDFITEKVTNNPRIKKKGFKLTRKGEWANTGNFRILEGLTTKATMYYNFQSGYCTLGSRTYWYNDASFESSVESAVAAFIREAAPYKFD
jgi:hypothetical protein